MRNKIFYLSTITLILLFGCACQPNPPQSIISGKTALMQSEDIDDDYHEEIDDNNYYEYPDFVQDTMPIPEAYLEIIFNAEVTASAGDCFHKTTVNQVAFDDAFFSKMVSNVAPNASLYKNLGESRSYWESLYFKVKQKVSAGIYADDFDASDMLKEIEGEMQKAPDSENMEPFRLEEVEDGKEFSCKIQKSDSQGILEAKMGGDYFYYSRISNCILQTEHMTLAGEAVSGEKKGTTIDVGNLSYENARKLADNTVEQMSSSLSLINDYAQKARLVEPYTGDILTTGWLFSYVPQVEDLTAFSIGKDFSVRLSNLPTIVSPWENEIIEVYVDDAGISVIEWTGAAQIVNTAESIRIIPFDEIISNAQNQLKFCHANKGNPKNKCHIEVTKIALGTALLSIENDFSLGEYAPCWYIFYDLSLEDTDMFFSDCLVITAHEGKYVEPRMTTYQLMSISEP